MADILDSPTQDQLVRPPYRWWDSHPPYVSSSGAPALTASAPSIPSSPTIDFLHPSYDYPANILFSLPAVDILRGPSSRPGVHHGTALSACIIVAANRCGRLTTSAAPPTPAELASPVAAWDAVLTEPRYYFHPSGATDPSAPPYPVVPDFRSWRFPHGQLEPGWVDTEYIRPLPANSTHMSVKVLERDRSCRVTSSTAGLHCSHVIPRCELDWFRTNTMSVYNANTVLSQSHAMDDTTNGFALRSDLNGPGFDAGKMVVVPKEGKLVLHFLFDVGELGFLYHNRELHPIPTVPREFLYARFAWALFPLLARFLSTEKNLSVARNSKSVWTVTEEFARWGDIRKAEAGSKRRRRDNPGPAGNTTIPGAQDDMEYTFTDERDASRSPVSSLSGSTLSDVERTTINSLSEPSSSPPPAEPLHRLFAPLPHDLAREKQELEEDYAVAREVFPQMLNGGCVQRDIAFYPGHRAVERLKRRLRRDRGWVRALAECRDPLSEGKCGKGRRG